MRCLAEAAAVEAEVVVAAEAVEVRAPVAVEVRAPVAVEEAAVALLHLLAKESRSLELARPQ